MNEIGDVLKKYFENQGITQVQIAQRLGVGKNYINNLLTGRSKFGKVQAQKWQDEFGFSATWLLTGYGAMMLKPETEKGKEQTSEENDFKLLPLINIDSVGGMHSDNEITDTAQYTERMVPFPEAREGDIAIYESGDSMAPSIVKGSIMQIRRVERWQEYFGYGQIYVIELMDGRRITKKICKSKEDAKKFVLCHSFNPTVDDEELPREMIKEVWKVVQVLNNFGF